MTTAEDVCRVIASARVRLATEKVAQADIEQVLGASFGEDVRREVKLSAEDRPDFMIGGLAIEVKLKGSQMEIYRQVERYAAHDEVTAIVLVTNRAMGLPREIGGKPAFYIPLGRAWL